MITAVDEAIRTLITRDVIADLDVDIVFETPTTEWSERRHTPTINVYLFDIREDLKHRLNGPVDIRDADGRVTGRGKPPRWFNLSYLVTAWAQRPEDEHGLLTNLLLVLARHQTFPLEYLGGTLADRPVFIRAAQPRTDGLSLADVWGTLNHPWRAGVEMVITAPTDVDIEMPAPLVLQAPTVQVGFLDHAHGHA